MNEQTVKLVENLAQKLGTTSEYLWGILIKQAPIDSIIGMGYIILVAVIGFGIWKIHKKLLEKPPNQKIEYRIHDNYYEKYDPVPAVILTIIGIVWCICSIIALCCIGSIFTGFYNPEYWALNKILSSLKTK